MGTDESLGRVLRAVFDTNVVVSALLFSAGRLAWLRAAWRLRRAVPLVSRPTAEELLRVLGYPKFGLAAAEQESLLADYLPFAELVDAPKRKPSLPHCRDPHDAPFLELALVAKADVLVSGDADLLELADRFKVRIVSAEDFRNLIGEA